MHEKFKYLLTTYFYQSWRAEHATWQEAIITFKNEEVAEIKEKVISELQDIIDNNLAEEIIAETGRFVTPFTMDSLSAHDWCIEVLNIFIDE